jgi:hypothetical protein
MGDPRGDGHGGVVRSTDAGVKSALIFQPLPAARPPASFAVPS